MKFDPNKRYFLVGKNQDDCHQFALSLSLVDPGETSPVGAANPLINPRTWIVTRDQLRGMRDVVLCFSDRWKDSREYFDIVEEVSIYPPGRVELVNYVRHSDDVELAMKGKIILEGYVHKSRVSWTTNKGYINDPSCNRCEAAVRDMKLPHTCDKCRHTVHGLASGLYVKSAFEAKAILAYLDTIQAYKPISLMEDHNVNQKYK